MSEHTVLEENSVLSSGWAGAPNPKLIDFYGYDGEDFRYFKSVLEDYFSVAGITQDIRRVAILKTKLKRAAAVFFDKALRKRGLTLNRIPYNDAISILHNHFITEDLVQEYEMAFNEMSQAENESPQAFLSRLYEAAELAEVKDEKAIHFRFRAGVLPEIKIFCREQSAFSFGDWVRHSKGWWNAHAVQTVKLVENPFVPAGSYSEYKGNVKGKSVAGTSGRVRDTSLKEGSRQIKGGVLGGSAIALETEYNPINSNSKIADEGSPTIAALAAKLEALELHQHLISYPEDKGNYPSSGLRAMVPTKPNIQSAKNLESFIKNIIQEELATHNEKEGDINHDRYYDDFIRSNKSKRSRKVLRNNNARQNGDYEQFDNRFGPRYSNDARLYGNYASGQSYNYQAPHPPMNNHYSNYGQPAAPRYNGQYHGQQQTFNNNNPVPLNNPHSNGPGYNGSNNGQNRTNNQDNSYGTQQPKN